MPELATPQLRGLGHQIDPQPRRLSDHLRPGVSQRRLRPPESVSCAIAWCWRASQLDPNLGPVFGKIGAETRARGGYAFHAHGGYALEIWADLVQRATNGVELLQFGIYRGIGLEGWYHVLIGRLSLSGRRRERLSGLPQAGRLPHLRPPCRRAELSTIGCKARPRAAAS